MTDHQKPGKENLTDSDILAISDLLRRPVLARQEITPTDAALTPEEIEKHNLAASALNKARWGWDKQQLFTKDADISQQHLRDIGISETNIGIRRDSAVMVTTRGGLQDLLKMQITLGNRFPKEAADFLLSRSSERDGRF